MSSQEKSQIFKRMREFTDIKVYGINNSFEIFQKTMEQTYGKIDRVKFISDDIIKHASDEQDLLRKLELLFIMN